MITAKNLIETVISLRLYVYKLNDTFMLYESLPEEGEGVKKSWRSSATSTRNNFVLTLKQSST